MAIEYTFDRIQALKPKEIRNLRANAIAHKQTELVKLCDAVIAETLNNNVSGGKEVEEIHFVCERDKGVQFNSDGTFWSGTWAVAARLCDPAVKSGAMLALHNAKSEQSYRQGRIIGWKSGIREGARKEQGVLFLVEPTDEALKWVGRGSGEKGYKWRPQKSI